MGLFMKVWDAIIDKGDYVYYDWVAKVDPDAVLMPDRLRLHVAPHTNTGDHEDRLFFVNCNAWPDAPTFPMMYGALEVFSRRPSLLTPSTILRSARSTWTG